MDKKIQSERHLMCKKYTLNITPQTFVRANVGDRIFFRIQRDKLRPEGLKRLQRLEKYNNYKIELAAKASEQRFVPFEQGMHIIFYMPIPKSWKEYKKKQMHLMLHQNRPDIDNLCKAFFDSLMVEDKHIADVRITKKWVNEPNGFIEIYVDLPKIKSFDLLL